MSKRSKVERASSQKVFNINIPPYRKLRLFKHIQTITSDFDFLSLIHENFHGEIDRDLSSQRFTSFEHILEKAQDKNWVFTDIIYTHSAYNWSCDNRLSVLARALIKGKHYTVAQWEGSFLFVKSGDLYAEILKEGTADLIEIAQRRAQ